MGGLVHSMDQPLHINYLGVSTPMMDSQLHCLDGFLFSNENLKHDKQRKRHVISVRSCGDVQRFDVKDKQAIAFQLESLILAQNERWRQA